MIRTILDWESAYGISPTGRKVTLSAMTTEEYVRDPEFKIHGLGVQIENEAPFYLYKRDDLIKFLKTHPWDKTFAIAHHAHFDGAILSWRCGIRPAFWGCTLSMARALFPHESGSLSNIARLLGAGEKGHELVTVKDLWTLTDEQQRIIGGYCATNPDSDIRLTARIFDAMKGRMPVSEMRLIDLTIRLFTEPVLEVERGVLVAEYKRERRTKRALLKSCATDREVLASGDKFAELLLSLGVDPPKKLSPSKVKDGRVDPADAGTAPLGILPSFKAVKGATIEERDARKAEKDAYPWAYAFGKSDEEFKLLLDHPDAQVQAVVEARLGIKSTIKETRSKRFFKIGSRGAFPVYHNYYGARTGRDSGGDKQNTTNLNRVDPRDPTSGALRKSLEAPEGHVLVVRDLGQIEARMLAYWAGQEDLLDLFRAGGDPYNRQGSLIFGYEIDRKKEEFYLEGLAGKAAVLGCFGPETLVLTNNGWKPIVSVMGTDMVWDGEEFVAHAGVIEQGEKECLTAFGVAATPDHAILTEHSWRDWQSVLITPSLFRSALSRGALPYNAGKLPLADGTPSFAAPADGRDWLTAETLKADARHDVIPAREKRPAEHEKNILATPIYFPTMSIENGYLTESAVVSADAIASLKGVATKTMPGVVLLSTSTGEKEVLGDESFWRTCSRLTDGTAPNCNSIVLTTTEDMNPTTCASLPSPRTLETNDPLESCKQKLMTYDIAFAGPRNRYTIATAAGPIIVHNCGYSLGWSKFQESLRVGFMGMPPILFTEADAHKLGADIDAFCYQRSYKKGCATLRDEALTVKPLNVSEEAHLWHCAAVKQIVDRYRASNQQIVASWKESGYILKCIERGEEVFFGQRNLTKTCKEGIVLPNGMLIRYHQLKSNDSGEFRYLSNRRKKEYSYLYGGKVVENVIQSLSRIVLTDQMLNTQRWLKHQKAADSRRFYQVVTSTYDEIVTCVPIDRAEECMAVLKKEMATAPPWCADLPLKSSGGWAKSYGDCEK